MSDYKRTTVTTEDPSVDNPTVVNERTVYRPTVWSVLRRIVGLLFGILQALILLRIGFLLLGANRSNGIVSWVLNITNGFVDPFRGIFSLDRLSSGTGSVLEVAAIVALVGWTLIELLILAILRVADRGEPEL